MEAATVAEMNEAPGPVYQHKPLDLDTRMLRLLHILPELDAGMLQCELTTHDFASATDIGYNALSYEWGPDEPPFSWIRINDGYYQIRDNLYQFFQVAHAKLPYYDDFSGYIWIDAVCIDQQNLSERGHQVKQMGDIYSQAKTVLLWLGRHHSRNIDAAGLGSNLLAKQTESFRFPNQYPNEWPSERAEQLLRDRPELRLAIKEIFSRTYWTRMWIVQEILLSKNAKVLLGKHIFLWKMFQVMICEFGHYFISTGSEHQGASCVKMLAQAPIKPLGRYTICEMVNYLHKSVCSDIRDRVYAVLALIPGGEEFPVDYTIPIEELFTTVILSSYVRTPCNGTAYSSSRTNAHRFTHIITLDPRESTLGVIGRVARAFDISNSALHTHLTKHAGPASRTIFKIPATLHHFPKPGESVTEHAYDVEDEYDWYERIEFTFHVTQGKHSNAQRTTDCAISVFWGPYHLGSTAGPRQYHKTLHLEDPCFFDATSFSVAFADFVAIASVVQEAAHRADNPFESFTVE